MVVEHIFITTLDRQEALLRAEETFASLGFLGPLDPNPATQGVQVQPLAGTTTTADWTRGLAKAARAKKISDLPQRARLEFDRGRITLALSVEVPRMDEKLHSQMLISIAQAIELALAKGASIAESCAPADAVQEVIDKKHRRATVGRWVALSVLLLIVLGIGALAVFAANHP